MKSILFLGGSHSQLPAIKYAKEQGYKVYLADYLPDNPGRKFADEYFNISTTDVNKIYELCKKLNIDAISSYASDPAAYTASYVSEKLNLTGNSINSIKLLTDKNLFRNFLKKNNFLTPDFFSSNKLEDIINYYEKERVSDKYIIKPVDASGSKGVFIVESKKDIQNFFAESKRESKSGMVIIEQYIERKGPQIHGEGFVVNRELKFLYLGDQYFDVSKKLIPFSTIVPSVEHRDIMKEAEELVKEIINYSGFSVGGINVEIIRDKNDNLYLLEIGPRSGGNFMPNLIKHSSGIDLIKANVDILFGKKVKLNDFNIDTNFYYAQIILNATKDGFLRKITMPNKLNGIVEQKIYYNICDKINKYRSSRDVLGVNIIKIRKNELEKTSYKSLLYDKEFVDIYEKEEIKFINQKKDRASIQSYFIMNKDVFFSDLNKRVNLDNYCSKLALNAEQIWLVAREDIKGFAAYYANNSEYGYISTISIHKSCQNKGYGKKMLKEIIKKMTDKNLFTIKLEVEKENYGAIAFYKAMGFKIFQENTNSFFMKLKLKKNG